MQVGNVQKLIDIFTRCFQELQVKVSLEKLEDLAVNIHRAMTVQARQFHTLEHVFSFVDPTDAIRTLAALYHDIVYVQVDMGFSPQIWQIVSPYIRQENAEYFVAENLSTDDRSAAIALEVFNLTPGKKLSSVSALNEFLSALVMIKQLGDLVTEKDLLRMMLCVEATIPFRGFSVEGKNHFDEMEQRLPDICHRYGIEMTQNEIIDSIRLAVVFANKDIENFAENDPGRFLDNTWKLLPETNAALRLPDVYSIGTYRVALQKMASFFDNLHPETVFSQYRGMPDDEEFRRMVRVARNNIKVAHEYLRIKIMGITILEALAKSTGGDAPVSLFLGDVPREGISIKRLEYFLPEIDNNSWVDQNSIIYRLLEGGRASDISFDMKNSPLSLFVFKMVPPEKFSEYTRLAEEFYANRISAHDYLMGLDPNLVQPIARATSIMVFTRRQALLTYAGPA